MKSLKQCIIESLSQEDMYYKLSVWMDRHPEEQKLWDDACRSWKATRQTDDDAIQKFMNGTDVRAFVDFMNDDKDSDGKVHSDDFETIKKIVTNT